MGFFDKVKNMFTEEVEEDEVKVEKIKNDVTHVAIESPEAKKNKDYDDEELAERVTFTREEKENKPVFFDDNDFKDLNLDDKPKEEYKPEIKEKELYVSRVKEEPEEKKIFKPTPIISPVYGILDKNYHKEDIVSRSDVRATKDSNESPIDVVRNKAYGTLEDELENTLFGSNSILFKKEEKVEDEPEEKLQVKKVGDDILSDLTDDIGKELDELLVKKESNTSLASKNKKEEDDEDLLGFIDSTLYKDGEE